MSPNTLLDAIPKLLGTLGGTVAFLMPGYLFGAAFRKGLPRPEVTEHGFVAASAAGGVAIHLASLPWSYHLYQLLVRHGQHRLPLPVLISWGFVVLLVAPLTLGFALSVVSDLTSPEWLNWLLTKLGLATSERLHEAWDLAFCRMGGAWVRVTLKNGRRVLGMYGKRSFASAEPARRGLYIQEEWVGSPDGQFKQRVPGTNGTWISADAIERIEFFAGTTTKGAGP